PHPPTPVTRFPGAWVSGVKQSMFPQTVRFGGSVTDTLMKFRQGDTSDYELLKHQLADPDIKRLPWLGRSAAVVEEYMAFLGNLVSAQTVYLRSCLKMIVSNFTPGRIVIQEGNVNISDSDDNDEHLPRNFDLCHQALQMIARYVPSTARFLMPILCENFPFVTKSSRTLECYVHNLLRVTVYFPVLRREILELVVSKMLKLDVSAPRREIEDAEENAAQQQQSGGAQDECLFDMEDDDGIPRSPSGPGVEISVMEHPVAERLDVLMAVLLAYIKDMCHSNGKCQGCCGRTKELYRDLVCVFDKLLLPTHACCHVQYALFYLCSFRVGLAEAFLEHLWKLLQSPSQPAILRQAAAGYIGSFLARAKFVPVMTVKACLDLLVPWLHRYIDSQDSGSFCDVTLHGPFYAACQAVFYTLVFRHRAILEGNMRKGLAYLQSLNLERIVMSQLNPLKVCLPSVANMFASITRNYQLVFCYTVIERNNRLQLPMVRSSQGGSCQPTDMNPLDSFFPFDPYLLRRSGKVIEPIYQVWEEPSDHEVKGHQKPVSTEEEDDFLHGETLQADDVVGMTPGSYESHLRSPSSVGSPPVTFLQRPF
uniref:RRN3 homolog, RNA polymerase I transcription factor n=1 Tax=Scleropages formosus TaxID=113540 RepID=A0A8C9VMK2_SCLFO